MNVAATATFAQFQISAVAVCQPQFYFIDLSVRKDMS